MLLQTILQISIFVFLSSRQFCQVNGQCVDQTGVITNGKTCVQLLASVCYDATFLSKCCQTCKAFYTGVTGCEYGDKVANCIVPLCTYYPDPNECCATCKVTTTAALSPSTSATTTIPTLATTTNATASTTQTLATATLTPTLATTAPTTSFIATTTTQPTITTTPKRTIAVTTATTSKTIAAVTAYTSTTSSSQGQCVDQTGVITNGKTCVQLLASDCYDATFLSKCCQTCKAFNTGATGCEYGDKVANCLVPLCPYYPDPNECCSTCKVTTTAATTTSTSATTTIPTLATTTKATTTKAPTSTTTPTLATTTLTPTLATTTPTTSFIATTTTQPTIPTTPKVTIAVTTATTSKTIATVTAYTSTTSSSQVPVAPSVSIVFQTTNSITLNVTLQAGSTANQFEITASTGFAQKIPLPAGNVSVEYVFNAPNDSGTCFTLQIVATNAAGISPVTILSNACYAPLPPLVAIVTQTMTNVTLNMTLPQGSLGNTFEVLVTKAGKNLSVPLSLGGSRSIQYVLDTAVDAGSCFRLEVITIVTNNPIQSQATIVSYVCYAPKNPEVTVVTQTTSNVTLTITLPAGSLGNNFEVKAIGGGTVRPMSIAVGGSRSIQYVLDIVTEAGTCFIMEAVTLVINNSIASDKTTLSNVCYAPKKPDVIVITQTISSMTLNITLPTFSLGNTIEIKVTGGGAFRSVPLTTVVSRSLQHVFNEAADAGTCFGLEFLIVVSTNPIKSDTTTITNACYAPSKPEVNVVAQTTKNITMNITLPTESLGNSFEVRAAGGVTSRSVPLKDGGSRSVQHVFNEVAKAGTCFSIEIFTLVSSNPIKSGTTVTSSCYVPLKPTGSVVEQAMDYIIFNMALQSGSTGKSFHVKVIDGKEYDLGIPEGSTDVQFAFNETGIPGTCFTLQVKTLSLGNVTESEASIIPNTCYAPKRPQVNVVETTIKNIKLNISVASDSFAKSFQIRRTGDTAKTVDFPSDNTSVFYLFESPAQAGTCFTFEIVAIAADDRARSSVFAINNTCYDSFPIFPGSLSAEEKMIVAVSSVGGLIFVSCAAAVLCIIAMKMKKAQQNKTSSPPRHHGNHRLRSHRYGNHRKIPDYFGTYYPTQDHSYNYQRYNLDPMTNNGNIQDYTTSQVYNWWQLTPLKTIKTYR